MSKPIPVNVKNFTEVRQSHQVLENNRRTAPLHNLTATTAPDGDESGNLIISSTDDDSEGYSVGSFWVNTDTPGTWVCIDATENFAQWLDLAAAGIIGAALAFTTINCPSGTDPVAGSTADTLNLVADSSKQSIVGDSGTDTVTFDVVEGNIVHDNLSGFVAAEHVDHSAVSVIAGTALTGGGTIESNRTLNVDETAINHDNLNNYAVGQHRIINDAGTSATELWSASKINSHTHAAAGIIVAANDRILGNDNGAAQAAQELTGAEVKAITGCIADVVEDTTPQLGGNLDVNSKKITSASNGNVELEPNGTGVTVIDKLEPRYRNHRAPFEIETPAVGDLVKVYIAGHDGAGAKAPYAKIIRIAANVEGASASISFNGYIRTVDSFHTGGTAVFAAAEVVTAYEEWSSFTADDVDSTVDGSADECVVIEVTAVGSAADWLNGWVELEIQD
jgi:hypothetical protein